MSESGGWRATILGLTGNTAVAGQRVHILRDILDDDVRGGGHAALGAFALIGELPPESRILLIPGVASRLGHSALGVRRAAWATLQQCLAVDSVRASVRDGIERLVATGASAERRELLGALKRWLAVVEAPVSVQSTSLIGPALLALSLLPVATAGSGHQDRPRVAEVERWLGDAHVLLREAAVRWLASEGCDRAEALDRMLRIYAADPDPLVCVAALRGWARRSPADQREAHFERLLDERRWLSLWVGPKATTVPLTWGQQITMIGGAVVEALADLARGDTILVARLLPVLEAGPPLWPVAADGIAAFMDLTRVDRPRTDRDRLFELIDSFRTVPAWWLARRVGPHAFDVGLSRPVRLTNAEGDLLWLEAHPDRWMIRARWREGTVAASDLGERFPLGPLTDGPAGKLPERAARAAAEASDRGWPMTCACAAASSLLRGSVTAEQGDRLRRLLAEHAIRLHRVPAPRSDPTSGLAHPLTSLRDRLTREILSSEPRPDAFAPGRGDIAITRISASGLRSLPGADGNLFIAAAEDRLEAVAVDGPPLVRALAAYVLAIHRRQPTLPPGARPLGEGELGLEAMMFLPLEQVEHLANSGMGHWFAAAVELIARATTDTTLPLPAEALARVHQVVEPLLVARGATPPDAWVKHRERLMLRLMLAWAKAPTPPRDELRPLLFWVLTHATAPVLQLLVDAWDPAKGRWVDDRAFVGCLARRIGEGTRFATWRHLDSRQVTDAIERSTHLRRLLAGLADAGDLVPLWLEARKQHVLPEHRARIARLTVEEHGATQWRAVGPEDRAFVHRTAGAIHLPCVARGDRPVAAPSYHLTRDDVIVGRLRDRHHASGWINALSFVGVEGGDALFRVESTWIEGVVRLAEGEIVDAARAPIRWTSLERSTVLTVGAQPDGDDIVLVCTRRDDSIPRLRRTFRAGGQLAIVRIGHGWRFDVYAPDRPLPTPSLDARLERALAALADGARYQVQLVDGWDPDGPVAPIRVAPLRNERRYDGVDTPEALAALLDVEPGAELNGTVLEPHDGLWWLDGLPLQLTLGAEHLAPDVTTASGPARPALAPPLRVVQLGPSVRIGQIAAGEPRWGVVVLVAGSTRVIRSIDDDDLSLETDLDLAPADRVYIDEAGAVHRFRGDIVACPIVRVQDLADVMGQDVLRNVRFLAHDRRRGGWFAAADVHTLVWIPGWLTPDVDFEPLVDVQLRRLGDELTATPLAATGLAARVGTQIDLEARDGFVSLRVRPPLVLRADARLPKQAILGPLEVDIEEAGDALIAVLVPPDLYSSGKRSRARLTALVRRGPVEVEGWMWRDGDRWRIDARQVDLDGALVDLQPQLLEMPAEELSWDPLRRWVRDNFRGRVRVWWDDGLRASARRVAPQKLAAWLQRLGINYLGDRPLIYVGDVDDELRAAWGLQGRHHLLEYAPGVHLALQPAELGLAHAVGGDRILRYRVLPERPGRPLRLEVLAVEVEFANRVAAFGRQQGVLSARVARGKLTSIADPGGDTQIEPWWETEVEGEVPIGQDVVFVRFKERRGSRLVFTVVAPEHVLDPGNLLLVEAVSTTGFAQRARLQVVPVDGLAAAEIGANDYSIDRMRLAARPPRTGERFLARVRADSDLSAPRLTCTQVPLRPLATMLAEEGEIEVLVTTGPADTTGGEGLVVEVQPGWTVRIPRSVLTGGSGHALGDRLVLGRHPRSWRIVVQARLSGPWDALPPGTPVFVLPWGSLEHRIRQWREEGQTVSGHVVGSTAAVVRIWMAHEPRGDANLLPARLGSPGQDQDGPAELTRTVGDWVARRLELDGDRLCLDGEEVPWPTLTAREAASHAELARWLRELRWRAEPGERLRHALDSGVFHRHGSTTPPVWFGVDHLLEQFDGPDGRLDRERRFVVADVGDAGLTVEIHPGREVRVPWPALVPASPWRDGMQWDPDGFGRGDLVTMRRGEPGTLILLDHEVGRLRRLAGAVVTFEASTDDDVIGPPPLSILACLAGPLRRRSERVKVVRDALVPVGQVEPGERVLLVPGPRGPVVHGEPHLQWFWDADPDDPLGADERGPDDEVIDAFGAFPCVVLERGARTIRLGRRSLIRELTGLPVDLVRTARPVWIRDSTRLLVLVAGIPWQIDRDAWCEGRINLMEPTVRPFAGRMMFDVAIGTDGRLSALAPRAPIAGEVDAEVVAHPNGVLLRVAGRQLFFHPRQLGWADLTLELVRHLFPVGTSIRLATDEDGQLGVDGVGAIARDLSWLRSRGGPVLVQPVRIDGDRLPVEGLARLRSGLLVNVDEELDVDAPAWVSRLRTERRQLTLTTRRPEQVWDLSTPEPGERAWQLDGAAAPVARRDPTVAPLTRLGARAGADDPSARIRRLWTLVRDQAHYTLLWPNPRHLVRGPVPRLLALGDALASLPDDGPARIRTLVELCRPEAHTIHDAASEAVRCWLTWLQVGASGDELEHALDRLRLRIAENRWSGLGVGAACHVVAAALSFARGDVEAGLEVLLGWDGERDSADPCIEAAAFWRGWLCGRAWSGPDHGVGGLLATIERLAKDGATAAELEALEARWVELGVAWPFDGVEIELADRQPGDAGAATG